MGAGTLPQVIVVDAGSTDKTLKIAEEQNCKILSSTELIGRKYLSLNLGAGYASGDVIIFLDADTILPSNYDKAIEMVFANKRVVGGAFEQSFSHTSLFLIAITWVNRIRYRISKLYFGDQALFCRREVFERAGGFPTKRIMESANLCRMLKQMGKLKLVPLKVQTSPRRFTQGGPLRVFISDTGIWLADLMGMNTERLGRQYWSRVDRQD